MRGPLGRRPVVEACRHGAACEVLDGEGEHRGFYSGAGGTIVRSTLRRFSSTTSAQGSSTIGDVDHLNPLLRATLTALSKIARAPAHVSISEFGVQPSPGSSSKTGAFLGTSRQRERRS